MDAHRTIASINVQTIQANDKYVITLTVGEDFLTAPSTVYPVYIDPSFNITKTYIADTYIAKGYAPNNYVNSSLLAVGYGGNSQNIRTLAKVSHLYAGKDVDELDSSFHLNQINSVYYSMYCKSNYSSSPTVDVYMINQATDWNPSTVTWNNGNVSTLNNATKVSTLTVNGEGRYNFDIKSAYNMWAFLTANKGLLFKMTTEVSGKYREFASANSSDSAKLPVCIGQLWNKHKYVDFSQLNIPFGGSDAAAEYKHLPRLSGSERGMVLH